MPTKLIVGTSHKQTGPAFLLILILFLLLSAKQANAQIAPPDTCTNGTKPNSIFLEGVTPSVIPVGSPNTPVVIQFRLNGGSLDIDPDANSPNLNAFAVIWSGAFTVSGQPDSVTAVDINTSRFALQFTADTVLLTPAQNVTLSFVATFCNGGAQTSDTTTLVVGNPTPNIITINPQSVPAGSPGFNLTVNGTGFNDTSRVRWNGSERPTTFVSSSQLTAAIATGDLAGGGFVSVTAFNPTPGGGASNAINFQVVNPAPTISSASPLSVTAGDPDFSLTVSGTAFNSASRVRWNGSDRPTTFVSSTQVTATISASDIATPGSASVTVFNPAPGGGESGAITFQINDSPFGQEVRLDVGTKLLVPSSARTGAFTSFLAVLNLDSQPNNVTITARSVNGSTMGQPISLTIPVNGRFRSTDILGEMQVPVAGDSFGPITVESTNNRILSAVSEVTSSLGLGGFFPGINVATAWQTGYVSEVIDTGDKGTVATYRTNVGFNTVGGTAANVTVTFHNNDGTQVGVPLAFGVPANGMTQRNLIVRDLLNSGGAVTNQNGYLRITSDQPLIAWASKIDNGTNDPSIQIGIGAASTVISQIETGTQVVQNNLLFVALGLLGPIAVCLTPSQGRKGSRGENLG